MKISWTDRVGNEEVLHRVQEESVADHFQYICFLGLLASDKDASWPCVVS